MSGHDVVTLQRSGNIALLRISNPPVNAISPAVTAGLERALQEFERDDKSRALVITCSGRTFVAGGDIGSFDDPEFSARPFNALLARLEAQERPVVAALHGAVLGGGLELALACHWRVAAQSTQFGFPEVKLGLLPGSLGTQRLPRLVGVELALDLISSGRTIHSNKAFAAGLIDAVVDDAAVESAALARASELLARSAAPRRVSTLAIETSGLPKDFFAKAAESAAREQAAYPAALAIVQAVQAAATQPFAQGEQVEARLFEELRNSRQSKALRHLFFAQREAGKIPGLPKSVVLRPVQSVGVLGAGTMGRGIAMNFLNIGMPTVLVDTTQQAVDAAAAAIRGLYEASAAKGKLTLAQVAERMAFLDATVSDAALANCDLVIEAVFENMDLKQSVMARLGRTCKSGAIIATNTSTLDVDVLARASGRAADVLGMHFFSPANVMRLLEVVRGKSTAPDVLAAVMQLARRIGKVAVVSGVCYGFIGNRMAEVYMREAEFLMLEGATPSQVDAAVEALGLAMGPCRMLDMAGIDVGAKTVIEYGKSGGLPPDASYRALVRRHYELGRFGQKSGAGYYRYDGRKPLPDPEAERIARELAAQHGIARRSSIAAQEIVERLIYPMVNEAAKILEEGIAYRGSDVDVVWTAGYGFPDHQGGPLFMADEIGLARIVDRLEHYGRERGNAFGYWTVSPLLKQLAVAGRRISNWKPSK